MSFVPSNAEKKTALPHHALMQFPPQVPVSGPPCLMGDAWNLYQNKPVGLFSSEIYFITLRSLCKVLYITHYPYVNCNIMMIY